MRFKIGIILFFTLGMYHSLSAEENFSLNNEINDRFVDTVVKIIYLNKQMQRNPKNIILDEIFKRRNTYTRYAQSLKQHMEMNSTLIAAIDVSNRYKLTLQKYSLSCEIAAIRTVVEAISGKYVSEEIIMREIPHFR